MSDLPNMTRQLERFDAHEDKRTKSVVNELLSIESKLDQVVACMVDISSSLKLMAESQYIFEVDKPREGVKVMPLSSISDDMSVDISPELAQMMRENLSSIGKHSEMPLGGKR